MNAIPPPPKGRGPLATKVEDVLKRLRNRPLLKEFADWLYRNKYHGVEEIKALLCEPWEGAYPEGFLGEDLLITIGNFLYWIAEFAVEKTYGENWWKKPGHIKIPLSIALFLEG